MHGQQSCTSSSLHQSRSDQLTQRMTEPGGHGCTYRPEASSFVIEHTLLAPGNERKLQIGTQLIKCIAACPELASRVRDVSLPVLCGATANAVPSIVHARGMFPEGIARRFRKFAGRLYAVLPGLNKGARQMTCKDTTCMPWALHPCALHLRLPATRQRPAVRRC